MTELQQTYSRTQQILTAFDADDASMRIIYQPSAISPYDRVQTLRFYGFITSLRMKVDIKSINEADLPDLEADSTRLERLTALRNMEWRSPRKQITFFLRTANVSWQPIFDISLLNRLPYYAVNLLPYLTDNISFDTSNDCLIAAQITNAGYGLLEGADRVTLYGSVREEITTLPTDSKEISFATPHSWTLGSGGMASLGQGITLMRGGGSYEINLTNLYRGAISAISANPLTLTGIEAV